MNKPFSLYIHIPFAKASARIAISTPRGRKKTTYLTAI